MNWIKKWYTYQKERFPVLMYGLYVFCIVFATFCFASANNTCNWILLLPMFIVAILQFLMVRIIDEFKDFEEDSKYRPYRPVPRGLIKLSELKVLFVICVLIQFGITIFCTGIKGIFFLCALWIYFALMSKDFFLKKAIDKHILLGVLLDELLMPFLVLYLSNFVNIDYSNIWKILLMSYLVSWIVEIARKVRCKEKEEKGVKTYTAVFGIPKAVALLTTFEFILAISNYLILRKIYIAIIPFVVALLINIVFAIRKDKLTSKLCELSGNVYIMVLYVSLSFLII